MYQPSSTSPDRPCADLVSSGERELAAFISAVKDLYGAEQARLAAKEWIGAIPLIDCYSTSPARTWRMVTITVMTRLLDELTPQALQQRANEAFGRPISFAELVQRGHE